MKNIIIGAGPAGLACAHTLSKSGIPILVVEKEPECGGLCRTLNYQGYLFDVGGHRFITKSKEISQLWHGILDGDLLKVKRASKIYYKNRYFDYPLSFANTFWKLGPAESFLCAASYFEYKYLRPHSKDTLEGWIINRFGKRLFDIFFKSYTEKVWGVDCQNISSDWAKQRIMGLSLRVAIQNALIKLKKTHVKTLKEEFFYPRYGCGHFYRKLQDTASCAGAHFIFNKAVYSIGHDGQKITSIQLLDQINGNKEKLPVDYLFSSIPLSLFVMSLSPLPPEDVIAAAQNLKFRSLLIVNMIFDKSNIFPDQWLYIHSPDIKLGRMQNYKNWSNAMVPDPKKTSLGLEYFCNVDDKLWNTGDIDIIRHAKEDLERMGIVSSHYLITAFVRRYANAYPIYTLDYQKSIDTIRNYLSRFSNIQTLGRAGLFRYDNSDHAMLTGINAAGNFMGNASCSLWDINPDGDYLET